MALCMVSMSSLISSACWMSSRTPIRCNCRRCFTNQSFRSISFSAPRPCSPEDSELPSVCRKWVTSRYPPPAAVARINTRPMTTTGQALRPLLHLGWAAVSGGSSMPISSVPVAGELGLSVLTTVAKDYCISFRLGSLGRVPQRILIQKLAAVKEIWGATGAEYT